MATNDVRMTRGDARRIRIDLSLDKAPYVNVSAVTHEIVFTCRRAPGDGIAFQKRLSNGGIVVDPLVTSRVYVVIGAGQTANMEGTYGYDVQVTEIATGAKTTPVIAKITFVLDYTTD